VRSLLIPPQSPAKPLDEIGRTAAALPGGAPRYRPFARGPREQWLRCEGTAFQRAVCWLHFHWPSARGQWRLVRTLGALPLVKPAVGDVPFSSRCGVAARLDIASDEFLFLSGRLAPEPAEVVLVSRLVGHGDVFVDVGAHWGLYVLHVLGLLGPEGTYVAVEPSPGNFRFLRSAFGEPRGLHLVEAAVSDYDGQGRLVGDGSVHGHLVSHDRGDKVKVVTLDALLSDVPIAGRRLFVKVDTEGHEAAVIRGCRRLAGRGVLPTFLLEFLGELNGQTREDVLEAIASTFGPVYDFWAVDSCTGQLSRFASAGEVRGEVRNMIALPRR